MKQLLSILLLAVAYGCMAPGPSGYETHEAATAEIVARLEAGDTRGAAQLYDEFGDWRNRPDALTPNLYEAADALYRGGDARVAADALDILAARHPDSRAIYEARVVALFVARSQTERSPDLTARLQRAIDELRGVGSSQPGWHDLAETQARIDDGDISGARRSFETFRTAWTGYPEELLPYVQDIERYLDTHSVTAGQ
ncbi:MAG: hypothetical protein AAFZ65_09370 [Planctomycetota bacterium]